MGGGARNERQLDFHEVGLGRVLGVAGECGDVFCDHLIDPFALGGGEAVMRVYLDGVDDLTKFGSELGDEIDGITLGDFVGVEVAVDQVLRVEQGNGCVSGDGSVRASRIHDLERDAPVLYCGAAGYHLRGIFQARAIGDAID